MSCIVGTALAQFPPLNCLCPTLALEVKWGEKSVWIMKYFQGNEILIFLNTAVFSDQIRMLCPSRVSRQKRPVVITRTVCSVRPKGQVLQCSFCSIIYLCNHLEQNLNCTELHVLTVLIWCQKPGGTTGKSLVFSPCWKSEESLIWWQWKTAPSCSYDGSAIRWMR